MATLPRTAPRASEPLAEGASSKGRRVTLHRECGRYRDARPYFVVAVADRHGRARYTPPEDRARWLFARFLDDVTDPTLLTSDPRAERVSAG